VDDSIPAINPLLANGATKIIFTHAQILVKARLQPGVVNNTGRLSRA
jgi:hypothetical protein